MRVPRLTAPPRREPGEAGLPSCRLHAGPGGLLSRQPSLSIFSSPPVQLAACAGGDRAEGCVLGASPQCSESLIYKIGFILSALPPSKSRGVDGTGVREGFINYKPPLPVTAPADVLPDLYHNPGAFCVYRCLVSRLSPPAERKLYRQESRTVADTQNKLILGHIVILLLPHLRHTHSYLHTSAQAVPPKHLPLIFVAI